MKKAPSHSGRGFHSNLTVYACARVISSEALVQEEVEAAYSLEGVEACSRVPVHTPAVEAAYNPAEASCHLTAEVPPHQRFHPVAEALQAPAPHKPVEEAVVAYSPEEVGAYPAPDHRPKVEVAADNHHHRRTRRRRAFCQM